MQFFKRYNYLMLTTFVVVWSVALGLFYLQYNIHYEYEISQLKNSFKERWSSLEHVVRAAKYQVEGLRMKAETYLIIQEESPPASKLFSQLQPISEQFYGLDVVKSPFSKKMVGNLTGQGSLQNREADFYREIEMALELNPLFQIAIHNVPNAVWVYYTSTHRFINLYPWVNSQQLTFSEELYQHEFYSLGLPANNPEQHTVWTNAYMDGAGKGLMVTCLAPVYDGEHFRGTVALDLTLEVLNQFIENFKYHSENLFINNNNKLLAHTTLVSSKDKAVHPAAQAFPETIRSQWQTLFQSPETEFVRMGDYWMIYKNLSNTSWKLIFWVPNKLIIQEVLYSISWTLAVLLPSLFIMLLLTNRITRQEFIRPAELLVEHLEKENQGTKYILPKVPPTWQPWFATITHIFTENRRLVTELKDYSASLLSLNQEKNEILSIVAHDLKNPLSAICGAAELIQADLENLSQEEISEYMGLIYQAAQHMFQLITNLLDVNAIESGKFNFKLAAVEIQPLVQKVINNYLKLAHAKQLEIHWSAPPTPLLVWLDKGTGEQILDNLISNAIKYSPVGKPIYIRLLQTEQTVCCEIQDEGPGLSEKDQQKLFGKFAKLTAQPTAGEHSTGLGLFIVKKLVTAMNGRVWCESELGKGTCFVVEFPKHQ